MKKIVFLLLIASIVSLNARSQAKDVYVSNDLDCDLGIEYYAYCDDCTGPYSANVSFSAPAYTFPTKIYDAGTGFIGGASWVPADPGIQCPQGTWHWDYAKIFFQCANQWVIVAKPGGCAANAYGYPKDVTVTFTGCSECGTTTFDIGWVEVVGTGFVDVIIQKH